MRLMLSLFATIKLQVVPILLWAEKDDMYAFAQAIEPGCVVEDCGYTSAAHQVFFKEFDQ